MEMDSTLPDLWRVDGAKFIKLNNMIDASLGEYKLV
jgi:hypothetical protein